MIRVNKYDISICRDTREVYKRYIPALQYFYKSSNEISTKAEGLVAYTLLHEIGQAYKFIMPIFHAKQQ